MRKSDHIFLIKNFVLKMKAEEYCFNTHAESNDTVYDIVDDVTGQLHAESRRHIPPYVNEICTGGQQTVHAKHDPQVNIDRPFSLVCLFEPCQDLSPLYRLICDPIASAGGSPLSLGS